MNSKVMRRDESSQKDIMNGVRDIPWGPTTC